MRTHVVLMSKNPKTGPMAVTNRTQDSCPTSCPLMGNGCYAESGPYGGSFMRAGKFGKQNLEAVRALRHQIPEGGWLRLNVSGDFLRNGKPDTAYIRAVNELVRRRPDIRVLAYTHAWRILSPDMFAFTVNASCESAADIERARAAGWPTVLADTGGDASLIGDRVAGVPVIRCPAEVREGITCSTCGACAASTRTRPTIAFVAHGARRFVAAAAIAAARG